MADAFSLAIEVVDITIKLVQYANDTKNALTEIAGFSELASYAGGIVQSLRCVGEKAPEGTACRQEVKDLFEEGGVGKKYHELLLDFQKGLQPVQKDHTNKFMDKVDRKTQRWKWSFKKDKTDAMLRRLHDYQNLLMASQQTILMDMMSSSDAATVSRLMHFVQSVATALIRNGNNVGKSVGERVLWASGDSGTGKSTIAAVVADNINIKRRGDTAVVSFFCGLLGAKFREADTILRCLARQLLEQLVTKDDSSFDAVLETLNNEYANSKMMRDQERGLLDEACDDGSPANNIVEQRRSHLLDTQDYVYFIRHLLQELPIIRVLEILLTEFWTTYCILDALDEMWKDDRDQLDDLVNRMEDLVIKHENIVQYALVRMRSKQRSRGQLFSQFSEGDLRLIAIKVANRSGGQFLNAVRHMTRITKGSSRADVDAYLDDMSSDLGQNADRAIARIKQQDEPDRALGMRALMWTVCSKRQLRISELKHALAMYSQRLGGEFDRYAIPDDETILGACEALVDLNSEMGTVETHRSLHDYFSSNDYEKVHEHFPTASTEMARICLSYLTCAKFSHADEEPSQVSQEMSFVTYAAEYWGIHVSDSGESATESKVFDLFLRPVNTLWAS
ncbi:MAG: hypothetical protein Q9159_001660 [Coniocarpon cinnabarinum]